uniref:Chitin-binding type-2 domain-containing protein n=1 Tax=Plectus sambesii TaxID=2011161 RepID=A0A914UKB6_9BILA
MRSDIVSTSIVFLLALKFSLGQLQNSRYERYVSSSDSGDYCRDNAQTFLFICTNPNSYGSEILTKLTFCPTYTRVCASTVQWYAQYAENAQAFLSYAQQSPSVASAPSPQSSLSAAPAVTQPPKTYTLDQVDEYCRDNRQHYLFFCPNALAYGTDIIVFCPAYGKHCNVALPKESVPTTPVPSAQPAGQVAPSSERQSQTGALSEQQRAQLCAQFAGVAAQYCTGIILPQAQGRCRLYQQFCLGG